MKCGHVDSLGRTCGLPRDALDHAGIAAVGGHSHLYDPAPPVDDEAACREIAFNYGMDDVCIHTAVDLLDVIREAYAAGREQGAREERERQQRYAAVDKASQVPACGKATP